MLLDPFRSVFIPLFLAVSLLSNCAASEQGTSTPSGEALGVRIGPLVDLLHVQTGRDKVKSLADSSGQIHVFIASSELQQIIEVVVRGNKVVEQRIIRTGVSPALIDAAFDRNGRLHLLIDSELFILEEGSWRSSDRTPWNDVGLKVANARFVPNAPDLIWVFQVSGSEVGAPRRVDIYALGGPGGAIIWPWVTQGSRTVVVGSTSSGYGPWIAVEPEGKEDSEIVGLDADRRGNVYFIYRLTHGGLGDQAVYRYARIGADAFTFSGNRDTSVPDMKPKATQAASIVGKPVPMKGLHQWLSVDPDSGTAFVSLRFVVTGDSWSDAISWPLKGVKLWNVRTAADQGDDFHLFALERPGQSSFGKGYPVQYLRLSKGSWSPPLEVGMADVSTAFGFTGDALSIVRTADGKVFLSWPTENAIVGRWIEPIR
jgi:hypothetical protein